MIELKQIRAFIAVAQQASFRKAAESMFFSQSALSKQIALLEADLGVKLFFRDKHSVYLTDAGNTFLPIAKDLQERADNAVELLHNIESDSKVVCTVHVGYEPGLVEEPLTKKLLVGALSKFMREHPNVRVNIKKVGLSEMEECINNGEVDIGICSFEQPPNLSVRDEAYNNHLLMTSPVMVVVPRSMLGSDESVIPKGSARIYTVENDYRAVAQSLVVFPYYEVVPRFFYCSDLMNIKLAVESGLGMVIMPTMMEPDLDHENVKVFPVDPELSGAFLTEIWLKDNENAYVKRIADAIKSSFSAAAQEAELSKT